MAHLDDNLSDVDDSSDEEAATHVSEDSDADSEDLRRREDALVEELLDEQYEAFVARQKSRDAQSAAREAEKVAKKRRRLGIDTELDADGDAGDEEHPVKAEKLGGKGTAVPKMSRFSAD